MLRNDARENYYQAIVVKTPESKPPELPESVHLQFC